MIFREVVSTTDRASLWAHFLAMVCTSYPTYHTSVCIVSVVSTTDRASLWAHFLAMVCTSYPTYYTFVCIVLVVSTTDRASLWAVLLHMVSIAYYTHDHVCSGDQNGLLSLIQGNVNFRSSRRGIICIYKVNSIQFF